MSAGQKILVGVVVAIIALFVVSIATQGGADGDGAPRSGLVDLLTERLEASAAVEPTEVSGSCLRDGDRIVVEGSCTLQVARSDRSLRQLKLRNDGPQVQITARIPRRSGTAEKDVEPGATISVAVDGEATPVGVGCTAASACQLTMTR